MGGYVRLGFIEQVYNLHLYNKGIQKALIVANANHVVLISFNLWLVSIDIHLN